MRLLPNGIKIGKATVIVDIISKSNPEIRPGGHMNPSFITDHDTGNAGRGANAEMHNRYIHNMANYHPRDTSHVSWHLTVDENYIYQHIPFDEPAYHCGDGFGVRSGNRTSIGVEKCMNVDGDRETTEENAIALHVYLLKNVINKTPGNVFPHQHWSGKYCPAVILKRDGSFNPYRKRIQNAFTGIKSEPVPKTKVKSTTTKKSKTKANLKVDGKWGNATTKALQDALGTVEDGIISDQLSNHVTRAFYGTTIDFGDGDKGSMVVKSLQRKIGSNVDGLLGPNTIGRLQLHLGTPHDKKLSRPSTVVKELQRRLNAGTF